MSFAFRPFYSVLIENWSWERNLPKRVVLLVMFLWSFSIVLAAALLVVGVLCLWWRWHSGWCSGWFLTFCGALRQQSWLLLWILLGWSWMDVILLEMMMISDTSVRVVHFVTFWEWTGSISWNLVLRWWWGIQLSGCLFNHVEPNTLDRVSQWTLSLAHLSRDVFPSLQKRACPSYPALS